MIYAGNVPIICAMCSWVTCDTCVPRLDPCERTSLWMECRHVWLCVQIWHSYYWIAAAAWHVSHAFIYRVHIWAASAWPGALHRCGVHRIAWMFTRHTVNTFHCIQVGWVRSFLFPFSVWYYCLVADCSALGIRYFPWLHSLKTAKLMQDLCYYVCRGCKYLSIIYHALLVRVPSMTWVLHGSGVKTQVCAHRHDK